MLYRALAIVALIAGTAGLFSCQQARVNRATTALDRANVALASANAEMKDLASKLELAQGTTRVVTEYVDRVQVVRERGHTITKEIEIDMVGMIFVVNGVDRQSAIRRAIGA